jgi:Tfp pilus assembly protein PilN
MRYLFISSGSVSRDQYRYGLIFRFAGMLLMLGILLQIPLLVFGLLAWRQFEAERAEQSSLRNELGELQKANLPLKETRSKLTQIRQWEPILHNRIPISSLLNAIQSSIPQNAVLDSISIETEQFDRLPVQGGTYRIPKSYRLVLQGVEKHSAGDALQAFCDALQKRLPTGSELIRSERLDQRSDGNASFLVQYSVKPSGNYYGLGMKKIAEPDNL